MRFNDLLRTILANMGEGAGAAITRWRQCIDLLAQYDVSGGQVAHALSDDEREIVFALVSELRTRVSVEQRIASVVELGGRLRSPGLVRLMAQDHPSLVTAMMARVRLSDGDWETIIPDLGPLARSVLRRRSDLQPQAIAALQRFGSVDLSITSLVSAAQLEAAMAVEAQLAVEQVEATEAPSQIGRIVEQIERFTEARTHRADAAALDPAAIDPVAAYAPPVEPVIAREPVNEFAFEADATGVVHLASGAPRSAVVGLNIGRPSTDSRHGADGKALGAFRRRAAYEHARYTIPDGPLEGEWRMSAEPRFDKASGRFLGYIGSARREFPHESLVRAAPAEPQNWAGLSAASTRQLIHELRTPLNAIQGYAEMIDAQLMGPVAANYRDMAQNILSDARVLLGTFDDLDMASRIVRGDDHGPRDEIDLAQVVRGVIETFGPSEDGRISLLVASGLPPVSGERAQIERMISHLVRAGCAALADGERLDIQIGPDALDGAVSLTMARPKALCDLADETLLDHGYLVDQKLRDGPALGLAFTLKLVHGIAHHLGGALDISPLTFSLILPGASAQGTGQENLR